ncbi:TetR/AcrR family transcriptional regulator [Rhizomicrobium electricum]|nr:TetR/AcrR family transcriptional regulator [Rhizomicrobium electricum]NIJ49743.1 TetR/AcrR family transcriptional regulator of autoinduction and epiphytic fitness [Rhizomicrobium electricum]
MGIFLNPAVPLAVSGRSVASRYRLVRGVKNGLWYGSGQTEVAGVKMTDRVKRDDRREQIIAVARQAFIRDGYAATSMSKISEEVGGSKRTLYSLFPSKQDLLIAVVDAESARLFDELYNFTPPVSDPRTAVALFAQRFISMLISDDLVEFERMIIAESKRIPQLGQALNEFGVKRGIERLAPLVVLAVEKGLLGRCNPRHAAEFLLDLCACHLPRLRLWNVIEATTPDLIEKDAYRVMIAFLSVYGTDEVAREVRHLVRT